ncbi:MAG TPA: DUF4160 domain-containing protein [Anaeromyxobacteraceae bacterium]|nr:DUF4160 domain-containing protein [Anaeromyxobacteraceae bacterium]
MPTISRFFGIVISMYFDDHAPPHFHARYGQDKAQFRIDPPGLLEGELPPRALGLVMEWARLHRDDLVADWKRAQMGEPLADIEPLV